MKIERGIPMPEAPAPKKAADRIPVESMEIGDSVFIDTDRRTSALGRCKATALRANLRMNFKSAREGSGTRVWRIA